MPGPGTPGTPGGRVREGRPSQGRSMPVRLSG